MHHRSSGQCRCRVDSGRVLTLGGEFLVGALSVAPQVPRSAMVHVSRSPPLIPDGRVSRVRLAAAAFPRGPSQSSRSLSARTHTPLSTSVRPPARRVRQSNRYLVQSPDDDRAPRPPLTESLFAQTEALPPIGANSWSASADIARPSSLLLAHAPDQIPPYGSAYAPPPGLCRLLRAPAGRWSFPMLSPRSVCGCLSPYPVALPRCSCPFLPGGLRPLR